MIRYFQIFLLIIASVLVANSVKAQYYYNDEAPISVGFTVGVNLNKTNQSDAKTRMSYNAGINVDKNLPNNLAIITGIDFWDKGSKFNKSDGKFTATYLSLPVQLAYRFEANPDAIMKFGLGGYVAYGLDGEYSGHDYETIDTFGDAGFAKRVDYGLSISARVTLVNIVQIRAGYDLGLANISKKDKRFPDFFSNIKNTNVYFAVGLKFF